MHRVVGRKHRLIEEIITTGKIPTAWSNPPGFLQKKPGFSAKQAGAIRRLDDLILYVQDSPLVGDEETREVLLSRLLAVRAVWSTGSRGEEKAS